MRFRWMGHLWRTVERRRMIWEILTSLAVLVPSLLRLRYLLSGSGTVVSVSEDDDADSESDADADTVNKYSVVKLRMEGTIFCFLMV